MPFITSVNGRQVYGLNPVHSAESLRKRGIVPSEESFWFAQEHSKWVEGSKKDQLSEEELQELKRKYSSGNLSKKETFTLLGELVAAGILTKSSAEKMWMGAIPLDESEHGSIRKYDPAIDDRPVGVWEGLAAMLQVEGVSAYENWFERVKAMTNEDVNKSEYFMDCQQFLDILKKLRVNN